MNVEEAGCFGVLNILMIMISNLADILKTMYEFKWNRRTITMEHISNEEKAEEIAVKFYKTFDDCTLATGVEKGAIEMAEWKDEQHKAEKQQWIEKACEWWKNELTYPTMTQTEIDCYQTKISEFKKAIKWE